ncbi:SLC13 family permease [Maridesulfovibrio hydrothermalis]|uniref:Sodium/sulphate symporter n=1 Tax=Maridesulfovibrio hydrothermalis AM13 = DSM 14728 TaxID=1121451 RepID=L0R7E3_9BACT|nr:SLC13 family permease [Maridesulfovibrio hydrothermalis]CCO22648.1 Sodium/sulphate symporter [Maridesulfovibrio hydrothermalis AM13 = DSM 14728]
MISSTYIYDRLPLLLLFVTGYILYRVIAAAGLPEYFAARAVRFSRGRADLLLLSLIVVCAGLSMFIPNAVTVLAMIPVIRKLDSELESMTTPLTLSIIYGANIGGMGSLIGSPANLILIGALDFFGVAGREQITFFNWFLWALPLVAMFLLLAWGVLRLSIPLNSRSVLLSTSTDDCRLGRLQRQGLVVFWFFLGYWMLSSIMHELSAKYIKLEPLLGVVFTAFFFWLVFGRGLLRFKDLMKGIPRRGILLLVLLSVLIVIVRVLEVDQYVAHGFTGVLNFIEQEGQGGYLLYFVTALVVILLTEFLSNTVVSTSFFAVIVHVAVAYSLNPLPLMILVSAASTCAFMTPVATPCNSLAVGEMRGMSFKTMLSLGLLLNVLGAVLLSAWIWKVVPLIYR